MFKKRLRLTSAKDRNTLLRRGRRTQVIEGLFLYSKKNTDNHPRTAVIVGKKFDQKAVKRNAQKRVLLAALAATVRPDFSYDILVSYTKKGKMLSYKDAKEALEKALNQLHSH